MTYKMKRKIIFAFAIVSILLFSGMTSMAQTNSKKEAEENKNDDLHEQWCQALSEAYNYFDDYHDLLNDPDAELDWWLMLFKPYYNYIGLPFMKTFIRVINLCSLCPSIKTI